MTNLQKRKNRVGFYLPLFLITVPATVVMRTIAYLNNLNAQEHSIDSSLVLVANISLAFFTAIFLLHSASHSRNDSVPQESFSNYTTYISSGLLSVSVIFAVYELLSKSIPSVINSLNTGAAISFGDIGIIASATLGIATAVSFLVNLLIEKKYSQIRALFGIFTTLFFSLYAICSYIDSSSAINVQQKSLTVLSLIFGSVFFLYETRISIGRSKWHSYVAFGLSSAALLYYTSIPAIIYYFTTGSLTPGSSLIQLIVMLALAIYVTLRVFLIAYAPEDEISELTDAILDMVHERNKNCASLALVNTLKEENDPEISSEN